MPEVRQWSGSRPPSAEWKLGVLEDGLGVTAFDKVFDDHFEINSDLISQALDGGFHECCASFPEKKGQPEAWGMSVGLLWKLWLYIKEDLKGYAAAHQVSRDGDHYCLVAPCLWSHAEKPQPPERSPKPGAELKQMRADMHLVVQRYVLPWTRNFDAGLALVLNAAGIAWSRKPADLFCLATTFVSHSWGEAFEDFAFTLHRLLDAQTVVWICSLALWQHGDVSASLSSLDSCPFAVAMRATRRVLVLTDNSAETLERCWVVFEAALAHELGKDYNICLPDCDASSWQIVGTKLEKLNMEACKASNEKDKEEILRYIRRQPGGISALNSNVRKLARQAMERSQLMQAAVSGDLARIRRSSEEELKNWRNVRGRTVLHVTAAYAQVAAMVEVLQRTNFAHLNLLDEDARSPLAVAVECGRVASVLALLALRADVELRALNGPTALQLAAKHNHPEITQAIVDMKGDLELDTVFDGRPGHRALTIACHEGCAKIVRLLVENRANMEARTSTGACALHVAAWAGRAEAAAALLAGRADVNITTEDLFQRTPLNLALMNGHSAMVGLLLGAKATVTQDDSGDGDTAGTPANTGRSRHKRRPFKRYSRKDARREAAQVLLRHESSTSERSFQRTDSRVSQIDLPIGPTSSDASQASRLSLPKVHFQEGDPNVRFFPGEENNSSDQAEVYVYSPESGSTEESSDAASLRSTPGMVPADGLPPAPWAALAELTFIPPTARWIALAFLAGWSLAYLRLSARR